MCRNENNGKSNVMFRRNCGFALQHRYSIPEPGHKQKRKYITNQIRRQQKIYSEFQRDFVHIEWIST